MNKSMSFNKDHYTVMANDIIKGKQISTLQQARFIRLMIAQIVKQDTELKTFTCRIQDFAKFFGIAPTNLYSEVENLCTELLKCQVHIGTGNPKKPWKKINWFGCAEYDGEGSLTLRLSEQITPYVLELNKWFTQYQLKSIVGMKSVYGIRLYEILKCDENKARDTKSIFTYEIQKLREILGCENKFKQIGQFKEMVIEKAISEINDNTDLFVSHDYIKTGRKVTAVQFKLYPNRIKNYHKKYYNEVKGLNDVENFSVVENFVEKSTF